MVGVTNFPAGVALHCPSRSATRRIVNMKPNMMGSGHPGRENQDSLVALAAREIGWSFTDLLLNMLKQAW